MTSSRSITSASKWLQAIAALLLVLGCIESVANAAGRKRVVVLDFEGPKADKFHDDLVKLIKKSHTVLPTDKWNSTAEELDAATPTEKNIKKVARKLKIDGVVTGKIEKRRDEYILRLKLHAGTTGEVSGNAIETKADGPRLEGKAQRDVTDELIGALDDLEANHGGGAADDDDDKPAKKTAKKSKASDDDDSDDKPAKKTAKKSKAGDDDDDSDDKPAKRTGFVKSKKMKAGDDDDGDDKPAKKTAKKSDDDDDKPAKKTAKKSDDDDDKPAKKTAKKSDDDDDKPAKKTAKKSDDDDDKPAKKAAKKSDDDDDKPAKKRAKKGDDDSDDDGDSHKKKVAKGGDDDDGGSAEAEADTGTMDVALALSPAQRAIDIALGASFTARRLSFNSIAGTPKPPPGYKQQIPVGGAYFETTVYPLAYGHKEGKKSAIDGLGVAIVYDRVIALKSQKTYLDMTTSQFATATLSTTEQRYELGAVYRYPLGPSASSLVVGGKLMYGSQSFEIYQQLPDGENTDIPNVKYSFIEPGGFVRYPFAPKVTLDADLGLMVISTAGANTGFIANPAEYGPKPSAMGFEISAGAEYMINKYFFARAAFHLDTVGMSFTGNPNALTNKRDTNSATQDVYGAQDTYYGGVFTVGAVY